MMDTERINQRIERWKLVAEKLLAKNKKAFIIDFNDDYHFCDLISVKGDDLVVKAFKGKRVGKKYKISWLSVIRFDEYREEGR